MVALKVLCIVLLVGIAHAGYLRGYDGGYGGDYGYGGYGQGYGHGYGHGIQGGSSRQDRQQDDHGYRFSYDIQNPHGANNGREESGDRWGNKQGSYYIHDRDGRARRVNYVADGHGFRAQIDTNERGTLTSRVGSALYNSAQGVLSQQQGGQY